MLKYLPLGSAPAPAPAATETNENSEKKTSKQEQQTNMTETTQQHNEGTTQIQEKAIEAADSTSTQGDVANMVPLDTDSAHRWEQQSRERKVEGGLKEGKHDQEDVETEDASNTGP